MSLTITIQPAPRVSVPEGVPSVSVDVMYMRDVGTAPTEGLADLPRVIRETVRTTLDAGLRGTIVLEEVEPSSGIDLLFLAGNGAVALQKTLTAATRQPLAVKLSRDEVGRITAAIPQPTPDPRTQTRRAFFIVVGDVPVPFGASKLQVAPVRVRDGGWQALGLDAFFRSETPVSTAVPWSGADLGAISWQPVHVGVDGRFSFTVLEGSGDAWVWWLTGLLPALGVVLDDLSVSRVSWMGVALPPFSGVGTSEPLPRGVPKDVTEGEVVSNPEIYTEDPGEFCKPFKNPERVLGERSFFVILRAEQPVISAEATVRADPVPTLTFDRVPSDRNTIFSGSVVGRGDTVASGTGAVVSDASRATFVRHAVPGAYLDMLNRHPRGRTLLDAAHPVQWEGDASRYQATTVARGHILELRMRWRSNGYSLGTVAKTLTLAPRQTKRIQKIEWERRETARRTETTQLVDRVSDSLTQERDYQDSVEANLTEWARGESSSSTAAGAGGFGFAAGGFVIGGGGGGSKAESESSAEGGRRTTASEEQRLRDSVRRYGDSLRRLESTVVTEVTQEESVTGTTEVVRNVNYGHALTVIYYQILRHLKIETGVGGVRECLFFPFAITPFTIPRAYRWREFIQRGLRDPRYADAIKYLKDVLFGFAGSDVPDKRRSDQPVRFISGSLFLRLAIERPKDKEDGAFDPAAWALVHSFLGFPALSIYTRLKAMEEARREAVFQKEHAPTIAARWVDTLQLKAGGIPLDADFTLASRYQFNGDVRVDFTVAAPQGVTREILTSIQVLATKDLPPGSVANLHRLSYTYQTDHFERTVNQRTAPPPPNAGHQDDLVLPETGARDTAGATLNVLPDLWERQNIRAEMTNAVYAFIEHLNEHVEHYHKVIWWNLDRDRIFMLVDGFYAPGTNGLSVASVVERDPIAIVGNSLVFRVASGSFLGIGDIKTPNDLFNYYADTQAPTAPMLLSLPTDGLYAQSVMDECSALEEHFGNTDWVLSDPDPELGTIAPELLTTRRVEPTGTQPTPFPQTIINLQNAPDMPTPQGLAGVLNAVTNPNAFRDMAGLAGTQANAAAAFQTAASLASTFGQQAAALKLAETAAKAQATQTADQKLASVQRAQDKGLIGSDEAQRQATKVLNELHSPNTTTKPHQDTTMAQAARAAMGKPGSIIEANTAEGSFKVQLASHTPTGGTSGGGAPTVIEPFPLVPYPIAFAAPNQTLIDARNDIAADTDFKDMCWALVDLTGNPAQPMYVGLNDDDMLYPGSLQKISGLYGAFELRERVHAQAQAEILAGLSPARAGWEKTVISRLQTAWQPTLDAEKFPPLPSPPARGSQLPRFPQLAEIFSFSSAGVVDFKSANVSDATINLIGQDMAAVRAGGLLYLDCLKSAMRQSNNEAAGRVIFPLSHPYLNGALRAAGLYFRSLQEGLWISGDFRGNDWPGADHALSPRWAVAQRLPDRPNGKSNFVVSARGVARFMTLLAQDKLISPNASQEMRDLMADSFVRRVGDALDAETPKRTPDLIHSKGGTGNDDRKHDCAIVERTLPSGTKIRYVVVGLGSLPNDDSHLKRLFVKLDDAIVALHP